MAWIQVENILHQLYYIEGQCTSIYKRPKTAKETLDWTEKTIAKAGAFFFLNIFLTKAQVPRKDTFDNELIFFF